MHSEQLQLLQQQLEATDKIVVRPHNGVLDGNDTVPARGEAGDLYNENRKDEEEGRGGRTRRKDEEDGEKKGRRTRRSKKRRRGKRRSQHIDGIRGQSGVE